MQHRSAAQGGILGSGLIIAAIGATGLLSALLHTISPITVAANIAIVGLRCSTLLQVYEGALMPVNASCLDHTAAHPEQMRLSD